MKIRSGEIALTRMRFLDCVLPVSPGIHTAVIGHGRKISERMQRRKRPGLAAIVGESQIRAVLVGMLVVAAGNYAMHADRGRRWKKFRRSRHRGPWVYRRPARSDRDRASGTRGRFCRRWRTRGWIRASRARCEAGIRRRECAFALHGSGQLRGRNGAPVLTIFRLKKFELKSCRTRRGWDRRERRHAFESQNTMESKNPLGFVLVNCRRQCWPASLV